MASDVSAELRAEVARRAGYRCEYCGIHEDDAGFGHQVDHIVSRKHGGTSSLENLAYSCVLCNRYKGPDVASIDPQSGEVVRLFILAGTNGLTISASTRIPWNRSVCQDG